MNSNDSNNIMVHSLSHNQQYELEKIDEDGSHWGVALGLGKSIHDHTDTRTHKHIPCLD